MKKLFENKGGNNFKLLSEAVNEQYGNVESGLKKVFANAEDDVSYDRVEAVGLGYIKDVSEAQRVAIQTARELAKQLGFTDDEQNEKFVKAKETVKEDGEISDYDRGNYENDSSSKEEKREIQIGNEILNACNDALTKTGHISMYINDIVLLANELIKMHGGK